MRLRLEKPATRFPGGKAPVFLYAAFLLAYLGLHLILEEGFSFCWFKSLTGVNCPTCGLSRAFFALFQGHPVRAFLHNPFMLVFSLGVFLQLFCTMVCKRRLALEATARERRLLLSAFLVLFLLNWAWLIFFAPLA